MRPSLHALAAADALVHLSWHDSFGFVGLEAMACGLPVVTTEWTGVSEIIEDGTSGVLVDPTSDTAIRRGIAKLTGEATRARLGEAAAEVAARHSEPRNFEEVLRVFELAAAERS